MLPVKPVEIEFNCVVVPWQILEIAGLDETDCSTNGSVILTHPKPSVMITL